MPAQSPSVVPGLAPPPDAPHRCVVIVHGIGQQARGSTLVGVGEPLAAYIRRYLSSDGEIAVETDLALTNRGAGTLLGGASSLISARIDAAGAGPPRDELLWLREAWWSERTLPPSGAATFVWAMHMWWAQLRSVALGMASTLGLRRGPERTHLDDAVYQPTPRSAAAVAYDVAMGLLLLVLFTLGAPLIFLVALLAWLVGGFVRLLRLPGGAAAVTAAQETFLRQVGLVFLYVTNHHMRGSIRGAVIEAILPSLRAEHAAHCQNLTIIAHSWGSVVALDALLQLCRRGDVRHRPLTLITAGAGLSRAWLLRRGDPIWRGLPSMAAWWAQIRWVNLWSRYDPVSAGPLVSPLWEALAAAGVRVHERRVMNLDDPLADHQAYWRNDVGVISIVAHEVLGHPAPPHPGTLVAVAARPRRQRIVRALSFVRLGAVAGVGLLLLAWAGGDTRTLDIAFFGLLAALLVALVCVFPPGGRLLGAGVSGSVLVLLALLALLLGRGLDELNAPTRLVDDHFGGRGGALAGLVDPLLLILWYKVVRNFLFAPLLEHRDWADHADASDPI